MVEQERPPRRPPGVPLGIESLTVGAFRDLRDVQLEQLGRINLLVGVNNAGKTSVLEAIAVLQSPFEPYEWFNVVRARETRSVGYLPDQMSVLEALRWMVPAQSPLRGEEQPPLPIDLMSEGRDRTDKLHITCEPINGFIDPETLKRASMGLGRRVSEEPVEDTGILIEAYASLGVGRLVPEEFQKQWMIWSQLGMRSEPRRSRSSENVQFLAPYSHRNSPANLRMLSEASKFGERSDIDDLLADLDPRIAGVEIITSEDGRYPKLAIRMRNGALMPQGIFGDGIRRALSIATAIRRSANGILLIDEIEAALHVSALDRVYRWIDHAAARFNVQIFATTHSLEAIEAVISSVPPSAYSELSAYTISNAEQTTVKRYTGGMLHRLVQQRGLDIRL